METNNSSSEDSSSHYSSNFKSIIKQYGDIFFGLFFLTLAVLFNYTHDTLFATLFSAFAIASFSVTVAEIAEILADRLGEPYGSFILTFSAVIVEIILLFSILLQIDKNPEGAIETVKSGIISAVIVDINVLLGLSVFIGGLAFKEQEHNEESSSTYGTILFVAASALLVPSILNQTQHMEDTLVFASHLIAILLIVFYSGIVIFQTKTHSHFFKPTARSRFFSKVRRQQEATNNGHNSDIHHHEDDYFFENLSTFWNFIFIFLFIFIIGFLAETFSHNGVEVFRELGISSGLAGLIIAIISVTPEIFTAVRAAQMDEMQRVVNIAMGASVVSIMLTVPILVVIAMLIGINLTLDFNTLQIVALLMTIVLVWKTTDDGETNYFEGISHLMFFIAYAIIASFY
jgi:Ca2+:H+ antiporter